MRTKLTFHVEERAVDAGKHVAGKELSKIFSLLTTFLTPNGPSLTLILGNPNFSNGCVSQKSFPVSNKHFSLSVNLDNIFLHLPYFSPTFQLIVLLIRKLLHHVHQFYRSQ